MKVLETRQTSEEIVLLSWSPRMDLLALANVKGELSLHRLSWQKVWQWKISNTSSGGDPTTTSDTDPGGQSPRFISWHPESLFIVFGFELEAYIIDVEMGKDIYRHGLPDKIEFIQWSSSKYEISSINENTPAVSPGQGLVDQDNDGENERTEINLSILLIGTRNSQVFAYAGGLLLSRIFTIPGTAETDLIIAGDASQDFKQFHFLVQGRALTLVQFSSEAILQLAPLLAPLGVKQSVLRNNWSRIQSQITTLSEHWEKVVDIYIHYMTYGKTKSQEEVVADYTELLLVGVGSVELEFFLGSTVGTREKEAKKHLNTITAAFAGIADALGKIKQLVIALVMGLVEIEGFLIHISRNETTVVSDMRELFSQLYFIALHLKKRTQDFSSVFRHFMRLVLNTIHIYHTVDAGSEFIEEDADPDKVLEFLNIRVEKEIFEFLLENMSREKVTKICNKKQKSGKPLMFGETKLFNFTEENEPKFKWTSLKDYIAQHEGDNGESKSSTPFLTDFSELTLRTLIRKLQLIPTITKKIEELFLIPVINSTPFTTSAYSLIQLVDTKKDSCGMYIDVISAKTYVFAHLREPDEVRVRIVLFQHESDSNTVKATCLSVSRPIHSCQFFGGPIAQLTILSYDPEDKRDGQENGRILLCQIPLRLAPSKTTVVPFINSLPISTAVGVYDLNVQIPVDMYLPGPSTKAYIEQVLPIEDFCPANFAVSGPRKVGAVLGANKRTVLLLEMDSVEVDGEGGTEGDSINSSEPNLIV